MQVAVGQIHQVTGSIRNRCCNGATGTHAALLPNATRIQAVVERQDHPGTMSDALAREKGSGA